MALQIALLVGAAIVVILKWVGVIGWVTLLEWLLGGALVVAIYAGVASVVDWLLRTVDRLVRRIGSAWREAVEERRWRNLSSESKRVVKIAAASVAVVAAVPVLAPVVATVAGPVVAPAFHRAVLAATPLLAAWSPTAPSYSAVLEPRYKPVVVGGRSITALRPGAEARLKFAISPDWAANSLVKVNPDPRLLAGSGVQHLTVALTCDFCDAHPAFMAQMTYRPERRTSSIVEFTFRPSASAADSATRELVLSVVNNDNASTEQLRIPVRVSAEATAASDSAEPVALGDYTPRPEGLAPPVDLVLFAYETVGNRVAIALIPIQEGLRRALAVDAGPADAPHVFESTTITVQDLEVAAGPAYSRVSDIVVDDATSRRLRGVRIEPSSRASALLSEQEGADVANAIAITGRSLYNALFVEQADPRLLAAIQALEAAGAKAPDHAPLRVLIQTDLMLPWQYLRPTGADTSVGAFWGMRFALTARPTKFSEVPTAASAGLWATLFAKVARSLSAAAASSAPEPKEAPRRAEVVFAHYAAASDPSATGASAQMAMLDKVVHVTPIDSSSKLKQSLKAQRNELTAIMSFLHASAGANADNGRPGLYFATTDRVDPDELVDLNLQRDAAELRQTPRYLGAAPLVILNACETGPSTVQLPHLTLEQAMFKLGASGVIATETPVWIALGDRVGRDLIGRLNGDSPAATALTLTRREMAKPPMNNPLGLLYAYYGDPGAGFRREAPR